MVKCLLTAAAIGLVLSGCAGQTRTVVETIDVPVVVDRPVLPPEALTAPIERPDEIFVDPNDAAAVIGLNRDGSTFVKEMIARLAALSRWAEEARRPEVDSPASP